VLGAAIFVEVANHRVATEDHVHAARRRGAARGAAQSAPETETVRTL
jgi:hypothetical protein